MKRKFTLKNVSEEPPAKQPYWILVCLLRSSAFRIGTSKRVTVKKAARLAVYEDVNIRVKIDQAVFKTLVHGACGLISIPLKCYLSVFVKFNLRITLPK